MENFFYSMSDMFNLLFAGMTLTGIVFLSILLGAIGLLATFFIRIYIAYRMAKNRRRDPLPWTLLSFCFSPLLTWVLLLIVGDANNSK